MVGAGRFERPTPCAQDIRSPHLRINRFNNLRTLLVGPCGNFSASSAESVGRFWFRESSQVVIKGNFHSLVGTKAVGSSGNHSDFVVETLNGAIGDFSFGPKPI